MELRTRPCDKCKAKLSSDTVRYYVVKGKNMILCDACAGKLAEDQVKKVAEIRDRKPAQTAAPVTQKVQEQPAEKPKIQQAPQAASNRPGSADELIAQSAANATMLCGRCNYKFKVDRSKMGVSVNLRCPYCGKNDRLKEF